jgi:hypothetical protein
MTFSFQVIASEAKQSRSNMSEIRFKAAAGRVGYRRQFRQIHQLLLVPQGGVRDASNLELK